ncbi:MAG TPA: aldo/keto reductase [Albitalea sp.]|uniref:aldo/keto reductase n=1 Tax=Piscinibacter sp. TaxID=1903157 RepID=UPI002ED2CD9C
MTSSLFPPTHPCGLRLGLGGAPLGNLFSAVSEAEATAVIDAAWSQGCRCFDTAPHYGNGLSEHRLGAALRRHARDEFVLSSKVGRLLQPQADAPREQHGYVDVLPFVQRWDYSRAGTRRSIEDSLQRTGMARIDVAYVHDIDVATHGERAPQVLRQVLGETLPELRALQREGLVGAIGLGVNDWRVVMQVLAEADLDALMLAGRYSLLDQAALAELLPECTRRGVRIALGGVFNSGILATGVRGGAAPRFNYAPAEQDWIKRTAAIEAVCDEFDVPLRAAALQFPLAHEAVEIVMVGARSVAEWTDCAAMMARPLAPAFWAALRERGLLPSQAPMPA